MSRRASSESSTWWKSALSAIAVGLLVGSAVGSLSAVAPAAADPASAAAETPSAVTKTISDDAIESEGAPMPDLEVTVSQSRNLVSQGIVVSWTGGLPSTRPIVGSMGGENFLQIAQCWGEDPDHPGHPDRRTCQYGASNSEGTTRNNSVEDGNVAPEDEPYTAPRLGLFTPAYTSIPFTSADGETLTDLEPDPATGAVKRVQNPPDMNTNQFFTALTTNEVKWAGSGQDGTGSVPFEVQTTMQSPGLGCGQPLTGDSGAIIGQSCWLVVIPRGTGDSGTSSIINSGLFWDAWEHHLAFKLDFKPVGVRCDIGAAERQLAGSELIAGAMASWQPGLCLGENGSAFVISTGNEAESLASAARTEPSALAFTSRPLETEEPDPVAYAPVALSSVAISFAIDRSVTPVGEVPVEVEERNYLPFTSMKLTPRIVAKLLTNSYYESLPPADRSHVGFVDFSDPGPNARTLVQDEDFLSINDPEWRYQLMVAPSLADVLVPAGRSDLQVALWRYVLADEEARAFLGGEPDPWGMTVNPWYSTSPAVNPTGTGLDLPRESFPKADPIEKPDTTVSDPADGTGAVNLVTYRPFTADFESGAYYTLRGDGLQLGTWDRFAVPARFLKAPRELIGSQRVMAVTTASAAAKFQTVTASLRNPAGQFVAPTEEAMLAAAAAMTPTSGQANVYEFDPDGQRAAGAATAYPLTIPVYAGLNPTQTDSALRRVYADLIRYAVVEGQSPGTDLGELPPGYAPLPEGWVAQALTAADDIENGVSQVEPPLSTPDTTDRPAAEAPAPAAVPGSVVSMPAPAPVPSGAPAGELFGGPTPDDPKIGPLSAAVPAGLASGLAAGAAVPIFSRIKRRFA